MAELRIPIDVSNLEPVTKFVKQMQLIAELSPPEIRKMIRDAAEVMVGECYAMEEPR